MPPKRESGGKWAKGSSGNPGGRPKAPVRLRELYDAKGGDDKLFNRLWELVDDADGRVAIAAIDRLLERRYGKAESADGESALELEVATLRAKLKMLEAGTNPDAQPMFSFPDWWLKKFGDGGDGGNSGNTG